MTTSNIQKKGWDKLKKTTGIELNQIFSEVCDQDKEKEWHEILGQINDIYKKTMNTPWFEGKYFLNGKPCIICKDEAHRIVFDCQTLYRLERQ